MSGKNLLDPNFYRRCLAHLAEVRELDFVVQQSLPIPYFGNLKRYLESPLRVLTAALNPSCPKSVGDIRAFRIEQWSDFTPVVKL